MHDIYKIMVVDDDRTTLAVFESILRKKGYRVVSATDGVQALEIIPKDTPDLIIMDLLMPHMHGFDVVRKIKSDATMNHIPVIIATAVYTGAMNRMEAINAGADDFIEKPINPELLLDKVERILKGN